MCINHISSLGRSACLWIQRCLESALEERKPWLLILYPTYLQQLMLEEGGNLLEHMGVFVMFVHVVTSTGAKLMDVSLAMHMLVSFL